MKKIIASLFLGLSLFSFNSCNTIQVSTDYDKSADFSKLKTFSFIKLSVTESVSQFNQERIIKSIKAQLIKKGFTQNDENPDFLVNATAIVQNKQSLQANTYGYGGYYRPYAYGAGMGSTTTVDVVNYKDGSIIIDFIDAKTQKLIWEGKGNEEIDTPSKNPDKDVADAISQIMYSFPPGRPGSR